jgi:hypothetical protein
MIKDIVEEVSMLKLNEAVPSGIGMLSDVIFCQKRFAPAYQLMRHSLVSELHML